ncbi:hypothetical protein [Myxosarcina sp. GI1(2024)]
MLRPNSLGCSYKFGQRNRLKIGKIKTIAIYGDRSQKIIEETNTLYEKVCIFLTDGSIARR